MMKIFCLYDKKSGEYSSISLAPNIAVFNRTLSVQINNRDAHNLLCTNPGDFDVFCVGSFDPKTADLVSSKEFMCNCKDLVEESIYE